jgi:hypothetical protein
VATNGHSIGTVTFYNGATTLSSDATPPYTYAWTSVAAGTYTLTARATYDSSLTITSAPVTVTVTGGQVSSPLLLITSVPPSSVKLSWTSSVPSTVFQVQGSSNLTSSAAWQTVTSSVGPVTLPHTNKYLFYRLYKP